MDTGVVIRNVANVANLSTPVGLLLALAGRARLRRRGGLIVADGARLPLVTASAMTIGSVALVPGRTLEAAVERIPGLLEHEAEHAWQYAYCLGLPFLPAYAAATAWSWVRTGDRSSGNCFEVQAGLAGGGYRVRPRRPFGDAVAEVRGLVRRWVSPGGGERSGRPAGSGGGGAAA